MSEPTPSPSSFPLKFIHLILFLTLQSVLIGAAFYLGTQSVKSVPVQNLAQPLLFPSPFSASATAYPQTFATTGNSSFNQNLNPNLKNSTAPSEDRVRSTRPSQSDGGRDSELGLVKIKSSDELSYTVLVGAYEDEDSAAARMEQLKGKGYYPFLATEIEADGQALYRVQLGSFKSEEDARSFAQDLQIKEDLEVQVILQK